ncbi:HNH endonuclease [Pedobacter sp.]|uniref:HNH endonuclease n=1 Tax=Pedobacter sp. TaxID=1411316 RepID=UPI0031E0551B
MKNSKKKERIFELFSQNLEWVKEHKEIQFVPDFSNGYICPLCFAPFFREDLDSTRPNPLTLEDIPPVSLGGKAMALTCKKCNSRSGHELDAHLLNMLLEDDSKQMRPNSSARATFEIDGTKVGGDFKVNADGTAVMNIDPKRTNPHNSKRFAEKITPTSEDFYKHVFESDKYGVEWTSPNFTFKVNRNYKERRSRIAVLRIAYLIAFAKFGNGFLVNGGLYKVREQLLHPDKNILGEVFWLNHKFPEEMLGLNIVRIPKELQCYLVIFNLKTNSTTTQFAVMLPGPSAPSTSIYKFYEENLCVDRLGKTANIVVEHIAEREFLKIKEYAFASHIFWQRFTDL